MKFEFSRQFSENAQIPNFMKIRPLGPELFRAERQMKLMVAFRTFANAPDTPSQLIHEHVRQAEFIPARQLDYLLSHWFHTGTQLPRR
jgi:hypothetical protein